MAALLPHGAARRLGGSLFRRVEADGRRWLRPRLLHTNEQSHEEISREIHQKKEELYNLMVKAEHNPRTRNWDNGDLLKHLSDQVTPRPHDTVWCHLQSKSSSSKKFKTHGRFALTIVLMECYICLKGWWKKPDLS